MVPSRGNLPDPVAEPGIRPRTLLDVASQISRRPTAEACAGAALLWMRDEDLVTSGLVATLDRDGRRLDVVASIGIAEGARSEIEAGLREDELPLLVALDTTDAQSAPGGSDKRTESVRFDVAGTRFDILPLRSSSVDTNSTVGLAFLETGSRSLSSDVFLVCDVLGLRLGGLECTRLRTQCERQGKRVRLLNDILHAVSDPIIASDAQGRTLATNRRADSLFMTAETDSEGRHRAVAVNNMLFSAAVLIDPELLGDAPRELVLVDPAEGRDLVFEPLRSRLSAPDEDGAYVVTVLRDITDLNQAIHEIEENYRKLKHAEARVRAERDRLDLIINSVADPVLVTNPDGEIELLNAPAARLFEVPADDRNRRAERAVRSNDAVLGSFVFKLFTSKSDRESSELQLVEPRSGVTVPVEAIGGKVTRDRREVTAVVTTLHDRTDAVEKARLYKQVQQHSEELKTRVLEATAELAEQNELLRRQAIELERASAMKSQFLANVSHELRTPLNAIVGYTQILLDGGVGELSPKQHDRLRRVESNSQHLLAIINDLLDLSRIESGNVSVNRETFPVPALLDEVTRELEALIARSDADLSVDVAPSLPSLDSDRQKVKQIMVNLLSNAIKFTKRGSIVMTARQDGDAMILSVSDTGPGIAPEDHERIFDEFHQADRSQRHFTGGTGLGLPICRRLADALGGTVTVDSELGVGSTFTLRLEGR